MRDRRRRLYRVLRLSDERLPRRARHLADLRLERAHLFREALVFFFLAGGPQQQRRARRRGGEVRVEARLVDVVEEREQRVVIALRDRIEPVVVAAGALDREPEHRRAECVHPIDDVLGAELLFDAAALVGLAVQPVEGRGDPLLARRARQEIAGQLPGQELIVGKVAIERLDDPVAVGGHVALEVVLVAVGVGVSRQIEPVHRHALAVRRRLEVAIDHPARRRRAIDRRGRRQSRRATAAGRSGRRPPGGSAPRAARTARGRAPPVRAGRARTRRWD